MKRHLLASLACLALFASASAEIREVLTPASGETVTDLSEVKVTFEGLEVLTTPNLKNISAVLKNETTGTEYVCVALDKSTWKDPVAWVTLKFGAEGTTTPLSVTAPGDYSLTIGAESFKSEMVDPTYYSPKIDARYTIAAPGLGTPAVTYGDDKTAELWSTKDEAEANKLEVDAGTTLKLTVANAAVIELSGLDTATDEPAPGSGSFESDTHEWTMSTPGLFCYSVVASTADRQNSVTGYIYVQVKRAATTMDNYSITPAPGASVSEISNVKVTFPDTGFMGPKLVDVSGITLTGSDGSVYKVKSAVPGFIDPDMTLTFCYEGVDHGMTIVNPGTYTLDIPAGAFCNLGKPADLNEAITATFVVTGNTEALPAPALTPVSGEVDELYGIRLAYDDAVASLRTAGDAWKDVALTVYLPAGELVTKCTAALIEGNDAILYFGKEVGDRNKLRDADTYVLEIPEGVFSGSIDGVEKTSGALTACYKLVPRTGSDDLAKVEFPGETVGAANMVWTESVATISMRFPDAAYGVATPAENAASDITLVYTPSAYAVDHGESPDPVTYHPASVEIVDDNGVTLTFDNEARQMQRIGTYVLTVAAGTFEEDDNANSKNKEITRTYRVAAEDEVGLRMYYNEEGTGTTVTLYKTEEEAAANVLKIDNETTLWLFLDGARMLRWHDDVTGEYDSRGGSPIPVGVSSGEHRYEFTGVVGSDSYIRYLNVTVGDGVTGGITAVGNAAGRRIIVDGGRLTVEGAAEVAVYSVDGALTSRCADTVLAPGIYIVVVDGTAHKIMVR